MESKFNICFVSLPAYPVISKDESIKIVGGSEVQQSTLSKALARKGFKVSIITIDHGQQDNVEFEGVQIIKTYKPEQGIIPGLRFIYPRLTSIWQAMKRANADIYYQRGAGQLTWLIAVFCKLYNKKFIYSGASNDDFVKNPSMIKSQTYRWLYKRGIHMADRVLVQNPDQQQLCKQNYERESTIVKSCYTCEDNASNNPLGYILWVSTLRQLKRPELLVEIANSLPAYQFKMVGGIDKEEEQLSLDIKQKTKNIPNFEFIGFVPYFEVHKYFDGARLLVNTSDFEGFPNTFLQAWARAIPTVSFIDCGVRVNNEPVGIITESLNDMSIKIEKLMSDDAYWRNIGMLCKQHYAENYSTQNVIESYIQIFNDTLQTHA